MSETTQTPATELDRAMAEYADACLRLQWAIGDQRYVAKVRAHEQSMVVRAGSDDPLSEILAALLLPLSHGGDALGLSESAAAVRVARERLHIAVEAAAAKLDARRVRDILDATKAAAT